MKRGLAAVVAAFFIMPFCAFAQDSLAVRNDLKFHMLLKSASAHHEDYEFEEAVSEYGKALELVTDSLLRDDVADRMLLSENGLALQNFVSTPVVVASHRFSLKDFFLFYPLADRSWRALPNQLDSTDTNPYVRATYIPENASRLYFSASDADGCRNLYQTVRKDSSWTAPTLVSESMMSTGDEIHPMLSPDGKSLYFASSGLYGVGGYDLYVSNWDEDTGDWGVPVNMGFPFSSVADDFLCMDSEDGRYKVFASNRDCSRDSVVVYVLEFDNVPTRKKVSDPHELRQAMKLIPEVTQDRIDNGASVASDIPDNVDTRNYMKKIGEVKALRDSIALYERSMSAARSLFAMSDDEDERADLTAELLEKEMLLPQLQDSLERASEALRKIEMDFLFKGVILDPEKLLASADREVVGASSAYTFTGMSLGPKPDLIIEKPVRKFDYSFMSGLSEGRFAEDNALPEGLVYQIQIMTLAVPATVGQLNGLSPVFEARMPSGRYVYRVGVFRRHDDALAQLNKVRKSGFRDAVVCAFSDGKQISIGAAREKEAQSPTLYRLNINTGGSALPQEVIKTIREFCDKDVVRIFADGIAIYVVSSFSDISEAEELEALVRDTGLVTASVSVVEPE